MAIFGDGSSKKIIKVKQGHKGRWEAGHVHGWAGKEYSESSSYQVEANFVGTGLWKDYVQSEPEK